MLTTSRRSRTFYVNGDACAGAANRPAEYANERPVTYQGIRATLYDNIGINLNSRIFDGSGRPRYLLDPGVEAVRELV